MDDIARSPALLLSVGGQPGAGAYANWIGFAHGEVGDKGVGAWRITPSERLPIGLAGLGIAQLADRLYVIEGTDGAGQYHSDVVSVQFDFGPP
jgi:hypothetical protein